MTHPDEVCIGFAVDTTVTLKQEVRYEGVNGREPYLDLDKPQICVQWIAHIKVDSRIIIS